MVMWDMGRLSLRNLMRSIRGVFPGACNTSPERHPFRMSSAESAGNTELLLPVEERDHARGPSSAPITVVEYGDYQCPRCGEVYLEIEKLRQVLGERLRFVFRQYPYAKLHPQAEPAAEAAEAAGAQGRFWEMHDMLFRHQDELRKRHLLKYAETLGLDLGQFCWELKHRVHRERVRQDFRNGVMNLVYTTPALFINGVRYFGGLNFEALLDAVSQVEDGLDLFAAEFAEEG